MARDQVDHYIPLFGRDFLTATAGWTAEERGHYITLLIVQWEQGGIPCGLDRLELVSPGITSVWSQIEPKFPPCEDGMRRNARMEEHRAKATELKTARSEAGQNGNRRRWGDRKTIANASQTVSQNDRKRIAKGIAKRSPPSPSPSSSLREEINHTHACEGDVKEPWLGLALDCWTPFREEWNRTPGAEPWTPLTPPAGSLWVDRISESAWLEQYPLALAKLGSLKRFQNPVTLTQFLSEGWVGRIVAGDFDRAPQPRGQPPAPPPVDPSKRRFFRSDSHQSMTDAEYAVWLRDKRAGGTAAALAATLKVPQETT